MKKLMTFLSFLVFSVTVTVMANTAPVRIEIEAPELSLSKEPKKCSEKLFSYHPKAPDTVCIYADKATRILSKDFDTCVTSTEKMGKERIKTLTICSNSDWKEKLLCAQKLAPRFGHILAYSKCENLPRAQAVSSNGFEGCMLDMSAFKLDETLSFKVCSSEDPQTIECVNETETGLSAQALAERCLTEKYRRISKSRYFSSCLFYAQEDGLSIAQANDICAEDEELTELIAKDEDIRECAKSAMAAGILNYFSRSRQGIKRIASDCLDKDEVSQRESMESKVEARF